MSKELRKIRNNLLSIMAASENAMQEVDQALARAPVPVHEGPTEKSVIIPDVPCKHPKEALSKATTMGSTDKVYCGDCNALIEV